MVSYVPPPKDPTLIRFRFSY